MTGALALLVGLATALVIPDKAHACVRTAEPEPVFEVDPNLAASDAEPPAPITDATAQVRRITDTVCRGDTCMSTDCGKSGSLTVDYVRPAAQAGEEVGYRLELLSGTLPPSMQRLLGSLRPLTPRIAFDVAFADVPEVDATIAVVIVDRAGNESTPSDPIEVRWSGCTVFGFGDQCLSQDNGCSAAVTRNPAGALPYALPGLALVALVARRGPRARRGRARRAT